MKNKKDVTNADLLGVLQKHDTKLGNLTVAVAGIQVDVKNIVIKDELKEVKSEILTSVDGLAKKVETFNLEHKTLKFREDRRDRAFVRSLNFNLREIDSK